MVSHDSNQAGKRDYYRVIDNNVRVVKRWSCVVVDVFVRVVLTTRKQVI